MRNRERSLYITMSLRLSAQSFQPKRDSHIIQIEEDTKDKSTRTLSVSDLGYEFPYTIQSMPIQLTPTKRIWSQMEHAVIICGTTYY